jgi:hypothetical protein
VPCAWVWRQTSPPFKPQVSLDYDLNAPLAAPRWLDGYQQFAGYPYSPGLSVIIDVRYVVPAAGSSAPAGWALLPVFERCGAFVASGAYQLPLFQVSGMVGRGLLVFQNAAVMISFR